MVVDNNMRLSCLFLGVASLIEALGQMFKLCYSLNLQTLAFDWLLVTRRWSSLYLNGFFFKDNSIRRKLFTVLDLSH